MHIYFSGIGGVGIGPLAEIAMDAGYEVSGSDLEESALTTTLLERGANVRIGQDGSQVAEAHQENPIDWFVYTAALPDDHPELQFAHENGITASKRDELLSHIIKEKGLKLVAVSGTHGKTTTTGMVVWLLQKCGLPVSYSIGTTISFGPSGKFDNKSEFFVYECDEYDKNFLHFDPYLSILPTVDYDHQDTYPTVKDYIAAFCDFVAKSGLTVCWPKEKKYLSLTEQASVISPDEKLVEQVKLAGEHTRRNAALAIAAVHELTRTSVDTLLGYMADFPGTDRRFEKLAQNLYSDYGHHPLEIAATLQMARELNDHVTLVYQPHQNLRQHEIKDEYKDSMEAAEKVYWLPTYLSREDPTLEVLSPDELISGLSDPAKAEPAELGDNLWRVIEDARAKGSLVLVMGAGSIDGWVRASLAHDELAER